MAEKRRVVPELVESPKKAKIEEKKEVVDDDEPIELFEGGLEDLVAWGEIADDMMLDLVGMNLEHYDAMVPHGPRITLDTKDSGLVHGVPRAEIQKSWLTVADAPSIVEGFPKQLHLMGAWNDIARAFVSVSVIRKTGSKMNVEYCAGAFARTRSLDGVPHGLSRVTEAIHHREANQCVLWQPQHGPCSDLSLPLPMFLRWNWEEEGKLYLDEHDARHQYGRACSCYYRVGWNNHEVWTPDWQKDFYFPAGIIRIIAEYICGIQWLVLLIPELSTHKFTNNHTLDPYRWVNILMQISQGADLYRPLLYYPDGSNPSWSYALKESVSREEHIMDCAYVHDRADSLLPWAASEIAYE